MKNYKIFSPTASTSASSTSSASATICTNCSQLGHQSKQCPQPITSYGVILFRIKGDWNQTEALIQGSITGMEAVRSQIEYLLIQRRDTIGFIEIMRGKYRVTDHEYIKKHLSSMTGEEHHKLLTTDFDKLWESLWGPPQEGSHAYRNEKEQAKIKMDIILPILPGLIKESKSWEAPEWGFPKGRRDNCESEYVCAMREMWEETNISERDIYPIRNMEAIRELFYGTNGIQYCHKYYIAYAPMGVGEESIATAAKNNEHIEREVRQIKWFSFDEAINHIRPENPEKRQVLLRVNKILQNFCPLAVTTADMKRSI